MIPAVSMPSVQSGRPSTSLHIQTLWSFICCARVPNTDSETFSGEMQPFNLPYLLSPKLPQEGAEGQTFITCSCFTKMMGKACLWCATGVYFTFVTLATTSLLGFTSGRWLDGGSVASRVKQFLTCKWAGLHKRT